MTVGELDDPAQVHDRDAVRDLPDDRQVVRDEDVGDPELVLQVLEQVDDLRLNGDVERGDGFVANDEVSVKLEEGAVAVSPINQSKDARSKWGMSRTMIENIFKGVKDGYERKLEINGVGYRASLQGKNLQLALGFSHDVVYQTPEGITIAVPKPTEIIISGINKQQVGQVAAEIREFRGPEPYKGKGVKYEGEFIFRKEGKKK
mgnify:CR=1 FL=1